MDALTGFDFDSCQLAAGTPGLGLLEYAGLDEVEADTWEPAVDTGHVQRRAVSANWLPLPFVVGTGSWSEDADADLQGDLFKVALSVFLPGDSAAVRSELNRMQRRRFLVRLTGRDGRLLLLGTPEQPLRIDTKFESGPQGGDTRGHRIRFSGESLAKSPDYIPTF